MSKSLRIAIWFFVALGLTACGPKEKSAQSPVVEVTDAARAATPGIRFEIEPSDAEVIVDGEPLGYASELMAKGILELSPGIYQIMIRRENFETARVEVTIAESTETLQLVLQNKNP